MEKTGRPRVHDPGRPPEPVRVHDRRWRRIVVLTALVGALAGCADRSESTAAPSGFPPDAEIERMLRYVVQDGETPGIVVGLLEPDGSTRILSFGDGGPGTLPLGPESVFEIGSVTKVFTGTLLADMVARGEVSFDDPVSAYLPDGVRVPASDGRAITLEDLATHTSGLPGAPDHDPAEPWDPWSDWTRERLYEWLATHELRRAPGSEYEYSNLGMGLLGHALSQAAQVPLGDLMPERIFDPLGMEQTGFAFGGDDADPRLVRGHQLEDTIPYWTTTEAIAGAGGLRSSAQDLLRFAAANLAPGQNPLEQAMRTAREARRPTGSAAEQIGLGWVTASENGRTILRHGGGTGGFRTRLALDPERRLAVVLLANSGSWDDRLAMDLIAPGPVPRPVADEVAVAPDVLGRYPGLYTSAQGLPLHIDLDDEGDLTGQVPGQVRFRLSAASDSAFFAERTPFSVAFRTDSSGDVDHLELGVAGNTNDFARTSDERLPSRVIAGNAVDPVDPAAIERYSGSYRVELGDEDLELRVWGDGGRLMANVNNRVVTRLVPRGEHEFALANDLVTSRVVFLVPGEEGATGVRLVRGDQEAVGIRVD